MINQIDREAIERTWPGMTVFFDVDGTIFRWQSMHSFLLAMVREGLFPPIVKTMLEKDLQNYRERQGEFGVFINKMVRVFGRRLPGVKVDDALFVARRMIEFEGRRVHVFTRELLFAAQDLGLKIAFVSGSPDVVVQAFAESVGVKIYLGTEYPQVDGVYSKGEPKLWIENKGVALRHLASLHNLKLEDSVAIGDSENDVSMFECVRWPICFNPNRVLRKVGKENHWPIVFERKDNWNVFKPDISGLLQETSVVNLVPQWFASVLLSRLEKLEI